MVKKEIKRKIEKIKKILSENGVEYTKLILFGSYARGLARGDSDIDICVVLPDMYEKKISGLWRKVTVSAGISGIAVDIIMTTLKKYRTDFVSPILHQVRSAGFEIK